MACGSSGILFLSLSGSNRSSTSIGCGKSPTAASTSSRPSINLAELQLLDIDIFECPDLHVVKVRVDVSIYLSTLGQERGGQSDWPRLSTHIQRRVVRVEVRRRAMAVDAGAAARAEPVCDAALVEGIGRECGG